MQDPHFKAGTHRRRIISRAQLADYAYLLAPGGVLYTITDVPELGQWMREKVGLQLLPVSSCGVAHTWRQSPVAHLSIAKGAWDSKCMFGFVLILAVTAAHGQHGQPMGCLQADGHPLFVRMSDEELAADPAACLLDKATEEGQKVARNSGLVSFCRVDNLRRSPLAPHMSQGKSVHV